MEEYSIERISREKLADLISIYRAAFGRVITEEELEKKYDTAFLGQSYVGYIAYATATREPAAYYGVFPMQVMLEGQYHLIAQSGDTMTHPRHQGKGLFTRLAKETYALCREVGITAVFGFPSESSYPGFVKKLDWKHPENIQTYTLWVYTLPLSALLKIRSLAFLYTWWVKFVLLFYKRGKLFQSSVARYQSQYIYRSEAFWAYKLRNTTNQCICIAGKNVILKNGIMLGIGDIDGSGADNFDSVLKGIKRLAFFLGNPRISFYVSPTVPLDTYLKKKFKVRQGLAVGYLNFSEAVDLAPLKYTYFDFDTF
ncbi:MAG TPA: GNAT family N-acetyltransferase [Ohtaekwangia sp.]